VTSSWTVQTNTNIAFRSANTTAQITKTKNHHLTQNFEKSGIYQLTCRTCHKAYVGQTSRSLAVRFRKHIRYIKNDPQSTYAAHILENIHEFDNIEDILTLQVLRPINKATLLLPYEQLYNPKPPQERNSNTWTTQYGTKPPTTISLRTNLIIHALGWPTGHPITLQQSTFTQGNVKTY
jgi:hypothetical protein